MRILAVVFDEPVQGIVPAVKCHTNLLPVRVTVYLDEQVVAEAADKYVPEEHAVHGSLPVALKWPGAHGAACTPTGQYHTRAASAQIASDMYY